MNGLDATGPGAAMNNAAVRRVERISLTVADLARSEAFYCEALGFEPVGSAEWEGEALSELIGIAQLRAKSVFLRLGQQKIELVSFEPRGRDYPAHCSSADPWFQHFAIVVGDMRKAYAALLRRSDFAPISREGPERLPPNTGSVTAFKFRDPDGHPLELTMFPPGLGPKMWHVPHGGAVFLGIDHSAIAVAATAESVAFYRDLLGLAVAFRSTNRGPEQERLDGLKSERVEITVMQPADPDSLHIELLEYPVAVRRNAQLQLNANDVAATRLWLRTDNLATLHGRLEAAGVSFISPRPVTFGAGCATMLVGDKDGHLLQLTEHPKR